MRAAVVQLNVFTTAADLHDLINDNVRPLQHRAFLEQQSFKHSAIDEKTTIFQHILKAGQ
jgi:hypothetical protein